MQKIDFNGNVTANEMVLIREVLIIIDNKKNTSFLTFMKYKQG